MNMTPSPEGGPLFAKYGLLGTSDTRKAQSRAPRGGCAPRRGLCTSGWDSDACPHWPLDFWSIFVPTVSKREEWAKVLNLLWCSIRLQWEMWCMGIHERRIQANNFPIRLTNDFPRVYVFQLVISSRRVCLLIYKTGEIVFSFWWLWRFYDVIKHPSVLSGA